ncbi:hypothetical protein [Aquifex aeolicus]|uniref:Uncharacterized protein aq_427 n=1 Tax=Aquifex aeolicus (strain VF5) TaxID=224324 RepID=Y427_AQUAE|nr:hypothetical protein [Aquifex aeolicus]O66741.1 RecName: Full=Uncharacterized protein aq_427 [Aquifex aeolicus VF5]AAC06700.1 putative protein [Aquifex aeolicus VF5]
MNLFEYKLSVVRQVMDKYEVAEEAKFISGLSKGSMVNALSRKKKLPNKEAKFTRYVIYTVDVERIIDMMEEPYRTVIKKRYYDASLDTVKKDFGLQNKREAYFLVKKSVNKFYDLLENYWK